MLAHINLWALHKSYKFYMLSMKDKGFIPSFLYARTSTEARKLIQIGRFIPFSNKYIKAKQLGHSTVEAYMLLCSVQKQYMAIMQTPLSMKQPTKGDRLLFSSSDDKALMKQIQETHAPDGSDINVKPLLHIVEDIFNRATPSTDAISAVVEDKSYQNNLAAILDTLSPTIDRVAAGITWKYSGEGDAHTTTMSILSTLSNYPWDTKLVISLAAFSMSYGEFWLLAQSYTSNQLAKSMAVLKKLPHILERSNSLKPRFDSVRYLIKGMVDTSNCIVKFKELPPQYIAMDVTALSTATAQIPIAVYWTVRSIVVSASQITDLIGVGHEHIASTTESWELLSLAHKLGNIHSHLMALLMACNKLIDERKFMESYQNLLHLFERDHIDNVKVLKALIFAKDDLQPLVDGVTKKTVNIDVLWQKHVLLLISDLDIMPEELSILDYIYNQTRQLPIWQDSPYEVVWLPTLDPAIPWNESRQKQFGNLQANMPWYTLRHPSLIDRAVIKFIKEVWHFRKKNILVVLDPLGRVASPNALYMMWIWGPEAFPFTTLREQNLWKNEIWTLQLLVDGIDPEIENWISEGRHICLYGGEDIGWIRKFTHIARVVAASAGILLGMVYVGKSNPKEQVRRNVSTIISEGLSHYWEETSTIWYFWFRIECMWHSKNQLGRTIENDPILAGIMTLLSFDGSDGGWAILSRGIADDMAKAKGAKFLTCLSDYSIWKLQARQKGFLKALKDHLDQELYLPHYCNRLVLPGTFAAGMASKRVVCMECGRTLERFLMYKCCDE